MIKQIRENLFSKINFENILLLYIIMQPVIDIITSLCVRNISESLTFGIFVRAFFMIFLAIYTFFKVNKKSKLQILIYYSLIGLYFIAFIINSYLNHNFSLIFTQVKGFIKTFYFPIILVSFLMLFKNKIFLPKYKHLNIALIIYVLTILICKIFCIGYPTYPITNNAGTIGLFYAGNEISAIIAILSPICFGIFVSKKFTLWIALCCFVTAFSMLEIGTKVAFLSLIGLLALSLIISIINLICKKSKDYPKQIFTIFLIIILMFLFLGNTSIGKNMGISPILRRPSLIYNAEKPSDSANPTINEPVIDNLLNNPTDLLSSRDDYSKNTMQDYKESISLNKFLGVGYILENNNTIKERKLVEIDYLDIFFCHGIVGTLIYIIPLAIVIIISIKKFFTNFITNLKNNFLIFIIYSVLIGFGIALMAGHVFTAPAVSMFLVLVILEIISSLYYEKDLKNE